jgi:O-antigen ligase
MRSLVVAARLAGLFAAGIALAAGAGLIAAPRRLTSLLLIGMALGIAMVAIDLATAGGLSSLVSDRVFRPTWLNQASISFAILVWPASAVLISLGQTILAMLLAAVTAVTVYGLAGTSAKVVLLAGLAMGLLLYRARPIVAGGTLVISFIAFIAAPLTFARLERLPGLGEMADSFKISAGHRLLIWSFAGDRIAERPVTGWGLDSSRAIPGGDDPIRPRESWMPLHPHNAALQVWLELGAPGAALFALMAAIAWGALARVEWPPMFAAAAGACLTIASVGCFTTYGIWQEWWIGTLSFSFFLVLVMARVAGRAVLPANASASKALSLARRPLPR